MTSERRFFIELDPRSLEIGCDVALSIEESHHARDVLRVGIGDQITLISKSDGSRYGATISSVAPQIIAKISSKIPSTQTSTLHTQLFYALSKGDTVDYVIEKSTELGTNKIILWQAQRSVVHLKESDLGKKLARYSRIAEAAAKQSNRSNIPEISIILQLNNLSNVLKNLTQNDDLSLICTLGKDSKPMRDFRKNSRVNLSVGPEGDFTDSEIELFYSFNFASVSLGPTVLRAETAAIAAVATSNALFL